MGAQRHVIVGFVKATLIGGAVFLLPVGVVIVVFGKLLALSLGVARVLHDKLFPGYASNVVPLLIAIAILVLIALMAGLFARTRGGQRVFVWLEGAVLARLPVYTLLRQVVHDMSGGAERLSGQADLRVVNVQFDDHAQLGFVVGEKPGKGIVVFLPGAPSALSGSVVIVDIERVTETTFSPQSVLGAMRRLGAGLLERPRD